MAFWFILYAGSLCWTRVLGKLFSRVNYCWIWLLEVPTFRHSCLCCVPCQMDTQSIRPSMGLYFCDSPCTWGFPFVSMKNLSEENVHVYFLQTPTLEHYTSYKTSQLQTSVIALEDLQLNTKGCCLNAIREKYRHQKVWLSFLKGQNVWLYIS